VRSLSGVIAHPLASGAGHYLDSAVTLAALLAGIVALGPFSAEPARLDPVGRDAGSNQRVTNIADPLLAQGRVVLIRSPQKIRRAVDTEANRRILTRVGRDVGDLLISSV
jgi:hypothetical protein